MRAADAAPMMRTVEIRVRITGTPASRKPTPTLTVPLPAALAEAATCTLADLIAFSVAAAHDQRADRREAPELLSVLTSRALAEDLERGVVRFDPNAAPPLDDRAVAIATAHRAFLDGLFLVIVDDIQRTRLEEIIPLTEQSQVTFLRLVALVGG